ncbi:hypothetical protein HDU83_006981 [Entophlyctis luteolus]|nr:hypothetical protein HDU83_006981 [Entophlyctis luteolus]KAJ3388241.1 hypothetical protein HDU84_000162 [Entophlyctis sp. JEL0112]
MRNTVLVLGARATPKLALVKRIVGASDDATQAAGTESDDAVIVPWTLRTKYYSVDLRIYIADSECTTEHPLDWARELKDAVDAVVLVFDSTSNDGFNSLREWAVLIEKIEPAIALCVDMNPGPLSSASESVLDKCAAWCANVGLELICLSDTNDEGDGSRDIVAFPRVVEALQAHMWDGLQREKVDAVPAGQKESPEPKKDPKLAALEFGDSVDDYDDLASLLLKESQFQALNKESTSENFEGGLPSKSGDYQDMLSDRLEEEFLAQMLEKDLLGSDDGEFDFMDVKNANMKALRDSLFGTLDDDDFFERAISQIKDLRKGGSAMSENQRRSMAQNLALALLCEEGEI